MNDDLCNWMKRNAQTDQTLAEKLKVHRTYVTKLRGGKRPSLIVAARLEEVTGIPARTFASFPNSEAA